MMRRESANPLMKFPTMARGLALFTVLTSFPLVTPDFAMAQQETVSAAPEPGPQQPPENNWFNVSTPGVAALARPDSFLPYGPPPNECCCPGRKDGCILARIAAWATYCPKNRVCSCCQCCNSCQYKGVVPLYLFFLNPKCIEGSGLHRTAPNECYRGCQQGCVAGAPVAGVPATGTPAAGVPAVGALGTYP